MSDLCSPGRPHVDRRRSPESRWLTIVRTANQQEQTTPLVRVAQMHMSQVVAKSSDLPNLDMLRACAVMMVLVDHTFQAVIKHSVRLTWLGRCGVLLFFVHTSCVLMMSLDRHKSSEYHLFRDFYVRRI